MDDRLLEPDAVYLDPQGVRLVLAMYDYDYVYLHAESGIETILTHAEFNERIFLGTLTQEYKQPALIFPK